MSKKMLFGMMIALCCMLLFCVQVSGAVLVGDVDGNGRLTAADARKTLRAAVGLETFLPGSPEFTAADTNGNGKLEASDARRVLRGVVALDKLPEDPAEVLVGGDTVDPAADWGAYDALIAQIRSETDPAKREALMHEAEDMLMSEYCVLPLYYYNDSYLLKTDVSGVYTSPYMTKYFQYASKADGSTTLRVNFAGEPWTLDPSRTSTVDGACLSAAAFAGLYTYDAEGRIVPDCAESYTVSEDGLTYTDTLKKGLKWSDGSDLTAADFAYAWKRAADPKTDSDYGYMLSVIEGYEEGDLNVTAVDDTTLRFVLNARTAYMEDLMAVNVFYPVKQSVVSAAPNSWCEKAGFVSNGPFICTEWKHDESIVYTKNPYYHNAADVKIERLEVLLNADETAVCAAFSNGQLDFTDQVSAQIFGQMFGTHDPALHIADTLGTYFASFRVNSPLFADKTPAQALCMRKAISLLIDREKICIQTGGGAGNKPAGTFIPAGMTGGNGALFHADTDNVYYDVYALSKDRENTLNEARRLLAAAGYFCGADGKLSADTPLQIDYLTNGGGNVGIANLIREDLAALGIGLNVREVKWTDYEDARREGAYDIVRGGWIADFNDPINMLELWTTDSGNNDCGFGK